MTRSTIAAFCLSLLMLAAIPAHAGSQASSCVCLTFYGVKSLQPVGNFYDGGAGKNYGITFSSNTLAIQSFVKGGAGDFSYVFPGGKIGGTPMGNIAIFSAQGPQITMNSVNGFTTGLHFYYTSMGNTMVTVWSGANGTGTVIQSIILSGNAGASAGCTTGAIYCNWSAVGLAFAGKAGSVTFSGKQNQFAISGIAVGTPGAPAPEPSALLLVGTGLIGLSSKRLRGFFVRS